MNRHARRAAAKTQGGTVYVFFREGMFYPITLRNDEDARRNAECNPGTLRVEDIDGNIVWRPQ
jgi:hypothetical protein